MMPRLLPHEEHELRHPRGPPRDEPTHGEIFDAIMDIRERLERIEAETRRTN